MVKRPTKSDLLRDRAFREVAGTVPSRVKQVRRTRGKEEADRWLRAIALDRAREMGARIPKRKRKADVES